jgi:hypothetical protein
LWHIICVVCFLPFQGTDDYNSRNLLQRKKINLGGKKNKSEKIYNEKLPFLDEKYSFDEILFI